MKILQSVVINVASVFAAASLTVCSGESPQQKLHVPAQLPLSRSATARYMASEQGRAWFEATGHPVSKYLNQAFGEPAPAAVEAARIRLHPQTPAAPEQSPQASVPCNGSSGARFNLEPRANALPQQSEAADFILNGAGPGDDLIVQSANDYRGNLTSTSWDGSLSGYYVHRAATPDCSVQFEGGLPSFSFQGSEEIGVGDASVVADPARRAFFMADVRFGSTAGIGLFRASASSLTNPAICPNGTHTAAQATSCWAQTPPVLLDPVPQPFFGGIFNLAVDERATASGKGAGDVYLVAEADVGNTENSDTVFIMACANSSLSCSSIVTIDTNGSFPYVQVRPDGLITISYLGAPQLSSAPAPLRFVTCTPAGAPLAPVCGAPVTVTTISNPLPTPDAEFLSTPLKGIDLFIVGTYPKLANRKEANGSFTTFLVYDDCKNSYTLPPPPHPLPTYCLNAEVNLAFSTNNGSTWSTPLSVDTTSGHHFYPAITTDQSTGTVNLVYYTTAGDVFHHNVRVLLNQIAPGSTALRSPQQVTSVMAPMDTDPNELSTLLDDFHIGIVARGTGTKGQSHLYTSFDLTLVNGTYGGKPLPEKNNHISLLAF